MALSLFRKYRPETFAQFVGQEHIAGTLRRAVAGGNVADAYLFSGPRGTGKTSTARLLAKALLCENAHDGEPDDSCEQCREIAAGVHPDVYELDAASRTGVENVRDEIISRVAFAPIRGRYKIYIIDEVHMLSTAAFNALLKTLEEPPTHIKFILCTTDPAKVPQTIQSRCQRFDFHRFTDDEIVGNLRRICDAEGFTAEEAALAVIAAHSQGGMRDALVTLEQIAVFGQGQVTLAAAEDMLGQIRPEQLAAMTEAIANCDVAACFAQVTALVLAGTDVVQFSRELTGHLRDLYICYVLSENRGATQAGSTRGGTASSSVSDAALLQQARLFGSTARLAACLSVAADLNQSLKNSSDERLSLEMALIQMSRPETVQSLESLIARVATLEQQVEALAAGATVGAAGAAVEAAGAAVEAAGATVEAAGATPSPATEVSIEQTFADNPAISTDSTETTRASETDSTQTATPAAEPAPDEPGNNPMSNALFSMKNDSDAQRLWTGVLRWMKDNRHRKLIGQLDSTLARFDIDRQTLVIVLQQSAGFTLQSLQQAESIDLIRQAIQQIYGEDLAFDFQLGVSKPVPGASLPQKPVAETRPKASDMVDAVIEKTFTPLPSSASITTAEPASVTEKPVTPTGSEAPADNPAPASSPQIAVDPQAAFDPQSMLSEAFGQPIVFETIAGDRASLLTPDIVDDPDDPFTRPTEEQALLPLDDFEV